MGYRPLVLAFALAAGAGSLRAQDATPPSSDKKEEPATEEKSQQEATLPAEQPDAGTPTDETAASAAATTEGQGEEPPANLPPGTPLIKKTTTTPPRDPEMPPPGTIRLRADFQEALEKGHYQARGSVDLRTSDTRVQADQVDIYQIERPDGTKGKTMIAVGNVVFIHGDERLAGDRATLDLGNGTGVFENARGFVQTGMIVEGRTIERLNADTYRIEGGHFTACTQPDPRWDFSASSATVHTDDKVVARNVVFRLASIPALYTPYFVYPIRKDQRATGFLFPRIGNSTVRGFTIGEGFFWAIGRSFDQTFYADSFSRGGYDLGHDIRWALDSPSRGDLRTFVYSPSPVTNDHWDFDLNWNALQVFPHQSRVTLSVRRYSNTFFQNQVQDNFNLATSRFQTEQVSYQQSLGFATVTAVADDNRVFFADQTRIQQHLPSVLVKRQPSKLLVRPFVFSFEARAEDLATGNQDKVYKYSRFDLYPQLSAPMATTFLSVTPRLIYRYTRYGKTLDTEDTTVVDGPGLTRRYFEAALELAGPNFSHVFENPSGFYSEKFKHVIGPVLVWTYRTAVDDFNVIPKLDRVDQQLGTHQVYYGLVQRIFAKRPNSSGRLEPFEFFTWTIKQTYYVKIKEGQNEFDPNYSSIFGPGGLPDHNSPIRSQMQLRPTDLVGANLDVEYDVNFKQVRNLTVGGQLGNDRAALQGSWNIAKRPSEDPALRVVNRNFVRGSSRLEVLPRRLMLDGAVNYDFVNKQMLQSQARLRLMFQCCGVNVEAIQYHLNTRDERIIRFSLDLANLGSMGSFMEDENVPGAPSSRSYMP